MTPEASYVVRDQNVVEVLPLHPFVQPDDWERPYPPVPVNLPVGEMVWNAGAGQGLYCRAMAWVAANPWMAAALVVAGWWTLTGDRRR
jgi:hypothetical protein